LPRSLFRAGKPGAGFEDGAAAAVPERKRTPQYQVLAVTGPDHARPMTSEVRLDGAPLGPRLRAQPRRKRSRRPPWLRLRELESWSGRSWTSPCRWRPRYPRWRELALGRGRPVARSAPRGGSRSTSAARPCPAWRESRVIDLAGRRPRAVGRAATSRTMRPAARAGVPGRLYFRKARAGPPSTPRWWSTGPRSWCDTNRPARLPARASGRAASAMAGDKRRALASGASTLLRYSGRERKRRAGPAGTRAALGSGPLNASHNRARE